jgi:hypothetical protein
MAFRGEAQLGSECDAIFPWKSYLVACPQATGMLASRRDYIYFLTTCYCQYHHSSSARAGAIDFIITSTFALRRSSSVAHGILDCCVIFLGQDIEGDYLCS